jgi:type I restriction enzyme S subunit
MAESGDWPTVRFADLAAPGRGAFAVGPFGSAVTTADYAADGVPLIRGGDLVDGLADGGFVHLREEAVRRVPRAIVTGGDLVFTRKGTIGQVALVPWRSGYPRYVISGSQMKATLDPGRADPEFYAYWFRSRVGQRALLAHASAVGVPSIPNSLSTLKGIAVPAPPLPVQRAVAAVLRAVDDKIAANRRTAGACDALRATLLHRFLTAASSAGGCAAGVVDRPLSALAGFVNGGAFTRGATGTGRMVVRIAELTGGPGPATVHHDLAVPDRYLARPGDVLFAWSGSLTVARWCRAEAVVNQHIFKVVPGAGTPAWLVHDLLRARLGWFRAVAADRATTTGHIQRRHLDAPVPAPAPDAVPALDARLGPLWDRALAAERESLTLAELRDALAPGLVTGRIRVR